MIQIVNMCIGILFLRFQLRQSSENQVLGPFQAIEISPVSVVKRQNNF